MDMKTGRIVDRPAEMTREEFETKAQKAGYVPITSEEAEELKKYPAEKRPMVLKILREDAKNAMRGVSASMNTKAAWLADVDKRRNKAKAARAARKKSRR